MKNKHSGNKVNNISGAESGSVSAPRKSRTSRIPAAKALIACAVTAAASVTLDAAARMIPGFADLYSRTVYVFLQGSYGRLTGVMPFSAAEVICILLPFALITDIIVNRHRLRRTALHILLALSVMMFLYTANCGVNYHRGTFVPKEVYSSAGFTKAQLEEFCRHTVDELRSSSEAAGGTWDGSGYPSGRDLDRQAAAAMKSLGGEFPELAGYYPSPKRLMVCSRLFSMMGVTGIYSPFTIEANINGEMPDLEMPFTACHELSHLRGYMNEGEANYIGWLACTGSDDPGMSRSGWLIAWIYAGNALYEIDPDSCMEIRAGLPEDAVEELKANSEFWRTHENKASEIQDSVNDAYLKSNGLEDGILSYDRLTTLMLCRYYGII